MLSLTLRLLTQKFCIIHHYIRIYFADAHKIRIGWTGSHSTLKYLHEVEGVLAKIISEYSNTEFVVIADRDPVLPALPSHKFIPWNATTEIQDLMTIDIGIMPLPDDEWAKGKCAFKALQYIALEFPAIASPVGVNNKIIRHGINGYLCKTPLEWEVALKALIEDKVLRVKMGKNGRQIVIDDYSVISNSANFLSLFE